MILPHSEQHNTQKRKNIALFAALLVLIALLYAITLMKLGALQTQL